MYGSLSRARIRLATRGLTHGTVGVPTRIAALVVLAGVAACGPRIDDVDTADDHAEIYSSALCDALGHCGCVQRFESVGECESEYMERFDDAEARGLKLIDDCFASVIEGTALSECAVGVEQPCTALQGAKSEGESCRLRPVEIPLFLTNECADGLVCVDSQCVRAPVSGDFDKVAGDPCDHLEPSSCAGETPLYCASDNKCHDKGPHAGPCDHPLACMSSDDYCKGFGSADVGECSMAAPTGAPCDPLDYTPCSSSNDWCDPMALSCMSATAAPAVCLVMDHFLAWPR